jgi:sensor domain CHASE-containing protein
MTTTEPEHPPISPARSIPSRRVLVAIAAGLIAMIVALGALVVDLSVARSDLQAQLTENRRVINALTKQLYWAEQQLDELK